MYSSHPSLCLRCTPPKATQELGSGTGDCRHLRASLTPATCQLHKGRLPWRPKFQKLEVKGLGGVVTQTPGTAAGKEHLPSKDLLSSTWDTQNWWNPCWGGQGPSRASCSVGGREGSAGTPGLCPSAPTCLSPGMCLALALLVSISSPSLRPPHSGLLSLSAFSLVLCPSCQ